MHGIIGNLKLKSGMYLFDNTYRGLTSFLMGYCQGVLEATGQDISEQFQGWLREKQQSYFSIHWSTYVLSEMSDNNSEQARELLLSLLEDFVRTSNK
jgi:uncharacterized membrane protein